MSVLLRSVLLTCALICGHHHGQPVHVRPPVTHSVNYALYPCAAGHPPVSPDFGACIGTLFIAS